MKKNELISYAMSFAEFLIKDNDAFKNISKIILFGSVARGDFDKESDIDIFIETNLQDKTIQKQLDLFNQSKIKEIHNLKGIRNDIVLKVGSLEQWKGLKESIMEDGIIIYGKYEESPKDLKHFTLFKISVEKRKFSLKVRIWRKLYGYKQKIGKKIYVSRGLLQELNCTKLSKGIFISPFQHRQKIIDFLDKGSISYEMLDVYKK
ncbi:nucleotidyltransferase domain-containing protein [Candidatus Woesearchaeota archaeon]|nr:nucleotidyltransferase domain-containing protein [Candidatus Woesearchaeota archaeon]